LVSYRLKLISFLDAFQPYPKHNAVYSHAQGKYAHQERFSDLYLQDMVQAGKMVWEEKVKRTEMSLFQDEFVRRGLRLVHNTPDQIDPVVNTCIGYAAVLGAELFTEMEGMVKEVSHLGLRLRISSDSLFSRTSRTRRSSS